MVCHIELDWLIEINGAFGRSGRPLDAGKPVDFKSQCSYQRHYT